MDVFNTAIMIISIAMYCFISGLFWQTYFKKIYFQLCIWKKNGCGESKYIYWPDLKKAYAQLCRHRLETVEDS